MCADCVLRIFRKRTTTARRRRCSTRKLSRASSCSSRAFNICPSDSLIAMLVVRLCTRNVSIICADTKISPQTSRKRHTAFLRAYAQFKCVCVHIDIYTTYIFVRIRVCTIYLFQTKPLAFPERTSTKRTLEKRNEHTHTRMRTHYKSFSTSYM